MLQFGFSRAKDFAPLVLRASTELPEGLLPSFIACLGSIAPEQPSTKAIVQRYLSSKSPEVRRAVLRAARLLEVPKEDIENDVADIAAHDSDLRARREAVSALGTFRIPSTRTVGILVGYLGDKDPFTVEESIKSLGNLRGAGRPALGRLTQMARDSTDAWTRESAAEAIGKIGDFPQEAQDVLLRCLADKDPDVRREAARALGSAPQAAQRVLTALRTSVHDDDSGVAPAAALSAWRIDHDDKSALSVLLSLIQRAQGDETALSRCLDALTEMGPAAQRCLPSGCRMFEA